MNTHTHSAKLVLQRPRSRLWKVEDIQAVTMGQVGFAMSLICKRTGLSPGRVRYRLKQFGITLGDYRNGKSKAAYMMLAASRKYATDQFNKRIEDATVGHLKELGWSSNGAGGSNGH